MTLKIPMTSDEFEQAQTKLVKLSVEVNTLARLILVENQTQTAAAASLGISKQLAAHHMKRVKALLNDQPADWVELNLFVPPWLAAETRAKVAEEIKALKNKK